LAQKSAAMRDPTHTESNVIAHVWARGDAFSSAAVCARALVPSAEAKRFFADAALKLWARLTVHSSPETTVAVWTGMLKHVAATKRAGADA